VRRYYRKRSVLSCSFIVSFMGFFLLVSDLPKEYLGVEGRARE